MDEYFELNGITFVWNKTKAGKNLVKHGVGFEQAVDASPDEEARNAIIGMDEHWNLLFVIHIEAEEDRIRIISARKATRTERWFYED